MAEQLLKIHSLESFGTHEGPGVRFVVFLAGCNFRCAYCHNPDAIDAGDGKEITDEEIINSVEKSRPYFGSKGGVTFSGGEPLLQAKALARVCLKLKKRGFNLVLDTNGSVLNNEAKRLIGLIDLILLDIKHIDPKIHRDLTEKDNSVVLEFTKYLEKSKKPFWLRYVLVPGLTDQTEYLTKLGRYFKEYKMIQRTEILPYHTFGVYKYNELKLPYRLKNVKTPTPKEIETAKKILQKYFKQIIIR